MSAVGVVHKKKIKQDIFYIYFNISLYIFDKMVNPGKMNGRWRGFRASVCGSSSPEANEKSFQESYCKYLIPGVLQNKKWTRWSRDKEAKHHIEIKLNWDSGEAST